MWEEETRRARQLIEPLAKTSQRPITFLKVWMKSWVHGQAALSALPQRGAGTGAHRSLHTPELSRLLQTPPKQLTLSISCWLCPCQNQASAPSPSLTCSQWRFFYNSGLLFLNSLYEGTVSPRQADMSVFSIWPCCRWLRLQSPGPGPFSGEHMV